MAVLDDRFIQFCRELIACDSTRSQGSLEAAQLCQKWLLELGFEVELQEETANGLPQANVIARAPAAPPTPEEIVYITHLDTVEPGTYSQWTKTGNNPFDAVISQGKIHGLGAAECKLDFVCKAWALKDLLNTSHRRFVLAGTFGEEDGMQGALRLVRKKKVLGKKALIGEPTDLKLVNESKGITQVEIAIPYSFEEMEFKRAHDENQSTSTQSRLFKGRTSHSSNPLQGESAILQVVEYLKKLPMTLALMELDGGLNFNSVPGEALLEIDMASHISDPIAPRLIQIVEKIVQLAEQMQSLRSDHFDPPFSTLNIGLVRTEPDRLLLTGCARVIPQSAPSRYEEWMNELAQVCSRNRASFRMLNSLPPFLLETKNSEFFTRCSSLLKSLDKDHSSHSVSRCTEANMLSRLGMECVMFGPGRSEGNVHEPNECVSLQSLEEATIFYREFASKA